jgi:cell division septum initiation protein DivIVA
MTSSSETSTGDSLVAILDELTDLVTAARAMPMSASALVNRAEVLELVESAKAVLPSQISQADDLVADADAVLGRARREASKLLEKARGRAETLVSQEAVVAAAQQRAEEILTAARQDADKLAREADDYCDRQLAQFEIDLGAITTQVAAGRARLVERARGRRQQNDEAAPTPPTRTSRIERHRDRAAGPVRDEDADRDGGGGTGRDDAPAGEKR